MYFLHHNLPTDYSNICVNFFYVTICSMWPPFLQYALDIEDRFIIIWWNRSSSVLHNSTNVLLSQFHWKFFMGTSLSINPTKGSQKVSNQGWEVAIFAAIVMFQIAVWHYARAKNNVKQVRHGVGSLQHGST